MLGQCWHVVAVNQVVGRSGMVGLRRKDLPQKFDGLELVGVAFVGGLRGGEELGSLPVDEIARRMGERVKSKSLEL